MTRCNVFSLCTGEKGVLPVLPRGYPHSLPWTGHGTSERTRGPWVTLPPPPDRLHHRRYASCGHSAGLSSFLVLRFFFQKRSQVARVKIILEKIMTLSVLKRTGNMTQQSIKILRINQINRNQTVYTELRNNVFLDLGRTYKPTEGNKFSTTLKILCLYFFCHRLRIQKA